MLKAHRDQRLLPAKEKLFLTHVLVGVLKDMHDELDAVVLEESFTVRRNQSCRRHSIGNSLEARLAG